MRFQRLQEAIELLKLDPPRPVAAIMHEQPDAWIEYNYSMYTVSLASLSDLGLLLTNDALRLGLSKHHCTADVVKGMSQVRGSPPISKAIHDLEAVIKDHRKAKNKWFHRGEGPHVDEVSPTGDYRYLQFATLTGAATNTPETKRMLRRGYKREREELGRLLEREIARAYAAVVSLCDALLPFVPLPRPPEDTDRPRPGPTR